MNRDLVYRQKIPVAILGATGSVGQKFVELLIDHPWFEITALAASEKSAGKAYKEAVNWLMPTPLPSHLADMELSRCEPGLPASLFFSALDAAVAGDIETAFAQAGAIVVSNARNHRFDPDVPLLVPEVNSAHLALLKKKSDIKKGFIVTNPNCCVVGIVMALKPLLVNFGLEAFFVTTLQAVSGGGYPGVSSMDILDNVIPYIAGEEEKIETEPLKILGDCQDDSIKPFTCKISAQCNRVPVTDGHTACLSVKLEKKIPFKQIVDSWRDFQGDPQLLELPSAPLPPLYYFDEERFPQPKLQRHLGKGMAVSIGRLRSCPLLDVKFTILCHNTIRGAAGGAILNAELLVKKGFVYW